MTTANTRVDAGPFVIWTRYANPATGHVIRHVYGPYLTRAKAQTVVRHMTRQFTDEYGAAAMRSVEVAVVKLLGER